MLERSTAWQGPARLGWARHGGAWCGKARRGPAGRGTAWPGVAREGPVTSRSAGPSATPGYWTPGDADGRSLQVKHAAALAVCTGYPNGMPEESRPDLRPTIRPLTVPINAWWRACIVALGLVALGSGGVAVFVTHLEAGPVALLAVGLVLLLVGAGGRLPSRLKVGENEAAWEAVEEFVSRVAEDVPTEQTPQLVDALNELAGVAPSAAAAGLGAVTERITYEQMVKEMLTEAVQEINRSQLEGSAKGSVPLGFSPAGMGDLARGLYDAIISAPNGAYLLVKIRHRVDVDTIKQIAETAAKEAAKGAVGALLISNQEPTPVAGVRLMTSDFVQHIRITGKDGLPKLVGVIRAAFEIPA